ncbi:MAG: VOC family protein [Acidobacteriota bacterium]|nr:VOC family protein [Acidobacteriota bacterium]
MRIAQIAPCLWFDNQAEQAATFYTSIFSDSKIINMTRYGSAGFEVHKRPAGSVMTVDFALGGHRFTALNGGPLFTFNEAVSFQILCETQQEIDYYWDKLIEGGDPKAQQCGWVKDKFGLAWQVVPLGMDEMMGDPGSPASNRAMAAMMSMKKLDIAALKRAYDGKS